MADRYRQRLASSIRNLGAVDQLGKLSESWYNMYGDVGSNARGRVHIASAHKFAHDAEAER